MRQLTTHLFVLLAVSVLFAGCETVEGMGQDFENTGQNILDAADKIEKTEEEDPAK